MKERYYFTQLAAALERAIHADVGLEGLDILMHGWIKKGGINRSTLFMRKRYTGEEYLTPLEVAEFSRYAGYDLTKE